MSASMAFRALPGSPPARGSVRRPTWHAPQRRAAPWPGSPCSEAAAAGGERGGDGARRGAVLRGCGAPSSGLRLSRPGAAILGASTGLGCWRGGFGFGSLCCWRGGVVTARAPLRLLRIERPKGECCCQHPKSNATVEPNDGPQMRAGAAKLLRRHMCVYGPSKLGPACSLYTRTCEERDQSWSAMT
eukprot:scaffold65_cov353-Prasinococcus_capsulatus_cf.AAC.10